MPRDIYRGQLLLSWVVVLLVLQQADLGSALADEKVSISTAQKEKHDVRLHTVTSPYQAGETQIRVLLPRERKPEEKLKVLYVLPVEAGNGQRWGDPVAEIVKHDLHIQHHLICVFPTFSTLPWYADHPSDPTIRQESYFTNVVVPFVEQAYPADATPDGRLLVGFSKSGYGAYSLLLRHPELFSKAAAWDAPLMVAQPNQYGMGPIFGTQENFENYRVTSLLKNRAPLLQKTPRLILAGCGGFQEQHIAAHALMDELKIKHLYRDGPKREHSWNSGWLPEAVGLLLESP
ncbi:Putative esterase [Symmachiella dynata]|uniref:Esterase n=1 Tax=Symmachiella dynata TaxID=2527995 RepID=A0A517ZRN2_9PLAN|nr:alpha/beta hydrolase-fold protein [Symmachiella dynata]QDU45134.1 Putative esterase [Symmachiella dynata]